MNLKKIAALSACSMVVFGLTGCDSDKEYTFEEALQQSGKKTEIVTDFLFNDNKISTNIDGDFNVSVEDQSFKVAFKGDIQSESATKSSIGFDVNLTSSSDEIPGFEGSIKMVEDTDTVYFILDKFNLDSDNEAFAMITPMIDAYKNKWFKISLSDILWEEGVDKIMDATKDYMKNYVEALNNVDVKAVYKELGHENYNGVFTQYNGKTAYQFTFDEAAFQETMDKIVKIISDYYTTIGEETNNEEMMEEVKASLKEITIDPFTGNLVINGEDVITVVDEMSINIKDVTIVLSMHSGDDGLYVSVTGNENGEQGETLIIDSTKKSANTYDVSIKASDKEVFKGTVTCEINEDKIIFNINVPLDTIAAEAWVKGNVKLNTTSKKVSSLSIEVPTDAHNFMELMGSMFGGMYGEDMYNEDAMDMVEVEAIED